ncbi:MAG: hypothetical protein K0U74_08590 [Alphaproteobacteria bacterium]|nr:hypothetical protein [Alphaproteobacteria bacterium]
MKPIKRRTFILGFLATGIAGIALPPMATGGVRGHLHRLLSGQFGEAILGVEGVHDFVDEYVAQLGGSNTLKKTVAHLYFSYFGPQIVPYSGLKEFEDGFLVTILTRSNIIAVAQGRQATLQYHNVNPYDPTCGSYLSAAAEDGPGDEV